ncbi:hypothetical protein EXIGLDRAFT_724132 [Exidia glandulosa HHB12029]|uniref:Non-reducing end beta-L-arabinofuranosidase-like GH127 middle domain-containing protein n=1 Tax=Exidia glandulosa HHB12029 TaxID=1314781 RepID=A0A165EJ91_EXIGL|nr:hypothetical protein EXIGLDRAFT_724132 [Exidia glandulosa HHB12029]
MAFRKFSFLSLVAGGVAQTGLAPKKFNSLPLGAIRPAGWLSDQLNVQMNGLAGHQHEIHLDVSQVNNTDWTGGSGYYSNLEEAGSYWFNAAVPAGILSNNAVFNNLTLNFLNYVIDHQDSTGWLGPEVGTTKPRYLWGRYPFFFGAIQLVEHDPTLADRVVPALHKFVQVANTMLHNNGEGVDDWAATRWEDFVMALQWLYDFHPNGNEALLIDTMKMLKATGDPWEQVFATANFPTKAVDNTPNPFPVLTWHGVNMAEGLKALPSTFRFTHNQSDLARASEGWDNLFKFHGRPSGIFAADEYLAGLEAHRGTELCLVVETMFSGSFLYQVAGDPKYADRVRSFSSVAHSQPLTPRHMWTRQYLQQQNQIAAKNMTPNPFPNDGPYSNVFGLEPNYRWPKFITNSFVVTPDNKSLVQVYLGPFSTSTTLAGNNAVTVTVDTQYPFSDTVKTTVKAAQAFTYLVRIPSWVVGGTIAVNGAKATAVAPSNGLHAVNIAAGTTSLVLNLPAPITTESRPHGAIAIHRGPLNYAFDIPRTQKILARNAAEPRAVDLEFDSSGTWQFAIDPSTLKFVPRTVSALPSPVFDQAKPPFSMTVTACPISWSVAGDTFAAVPPTSPRCTGANTTLTLWPYGATKLRISEFPVMHA